MFSASPARYRTQQRGSALHLIATATYWPFFAYLVGVVGLLALMIGLPQLLGQRHREPGTDKPYEGGIASYGSAQVRLSAKYFLYAVFFVIFDLEVVFLVAWAVAARRLGWSGFASAAVFAGVLAVSLAYLWRTGALDWGTTALLKHRRARRASGGSQG